VLFLILCILLVIFSARKTRSLMLGVKEQTPAPTKTSAAVPKIPEAKPRPLPAGRETQAIPAPAPVPAPARESGKEVQNFPEPTQSQPRVEESDVKKE
jgi:hypothetical protein